MTSFPLCEFHKQPLRFICSSDYYPLCPTCIPSHTQHHLTSSHQPLIIQQLKQFISSTNEDILSLTDTVLILKSQLQDLIDPNKIYKESNLNNIRILLVDHINSVFDEIKEEFKRIVELKIEDGLVDWREEVKRLEFVRYQLKERYCGREGEDEITLMKQYRQKKTEYQEIIDKIEKNIQEVNQNDFLPFKYSSNINQTKDKISQLIFQALKNKNQPTSSKQQIIIITERQKEKTQKLPPKKQGKIQSKIKSKPLIKQRQKKRCQFCNEQLEYLTQLKKHLVCKSCGNKERNYIKRP